MATPTHFTFAYWCVLAAALLPIACAALAKRGKAGGHGFDNANPRAWLGRQQDWAARANAAQANSFEALPFFIGAVVIAHQLGARQTPLDLLAFAFVALRIAYIAMYVGNLPTARSVMWVLAFGVNCAILFVGWR